MGARAISAKAAVKDEVTYFYLVQRTDKDASEADKKKARAEITKAIRDEGGQCRLYATHGSPFDFVSVVTGITVAGAVRIAAVVDKPGTVKATLVPGIENFSTS